MRKPDGNELGAGGGDHDGGFSFKAEAGVRREKREKKKKAGPPVTLLLVGMKRTWQGKV